MKLSEVEKVDCDLRSCYQMRERAREQLTDALIQLLSIEHRVDVLLERRNAVAAEQ